MKLLLDESIPIRLADHFPNEFSVATASAEDRPTCVSRARLSSTSSRHYPCSRLLLGVNGQLSGWVDSASCWTVIAGVLAHPATKRGDSRIFLL